MGNRRQPGQENRRRPAGALVDQRSPPLSAACALWQQGRRSDAVALFDDTMRRQPNNVQAYIVPARAYGQRYDFERMEESLEKLVRRAPHHPGVHHYIAETYGGLKLPQRATRSYEIAAALPGAGPPTWMELASLYERAHRLDEAEELIERAVRSGYNLPLVWLVRGRIARRQKRLADAESSYRTVIERAGPQVDWTCEAWSELALMKDAEGDYHGALDAIEQCKQLQRTREAAHREVSETGVRMFRQLVESLSKHKLSQWRDEAAGLPPVRTALLTGFPRSGTTLLEQVLDAHSDLVSSEERDFLGNEVVRTISQSRPTTALLEVLDSLSANQIGDERKRYFKSMEYLLGEPIAGRLHLDKNPAYNLVIPLLLRIFPEARLIIAIRDPRDVVLSCYLRYLPLNAVSVSFLDMHGTAEHYARDMAAWLKLRELVDAPWVQIRYEDVVADMPGQARRALEVLGLPWDERVLGYRQRLKEEKRVSSPSYEAVARPIHTQAIGRWQHYERLLAPVLKTLKPYLREFGYD